MQSTADTSSSKKTTSKIGLILLAYIAFISLGLPDGLLGVAWPSIRGNFSLRLDAFGLLLIAGTSGYLTSSFFSGRAMAKLSVGGLLALSCAATATSLIGYTIAPAFWVMIVLNVLGGLGAGAIDAGINTYIASEHGERLMQWLHASFGVGVTLGPFIMTTGINQFNSWRLGYMVVGVAQLALAACFALTMGLWRRRPASSAAEAQAETPAEDRRLLDYSTPIRSTLAQPRTWLSIGLFLLYTGVEISLGHWAYTLLTESRGVAPQTAGMIAGSYWGMFTIGRILAGLYTRRVKVTTLLAGSMALALVGVILLWWNPSEAVSLAGVAITGFAIAPIFPALVSDTSRRVGPRHAANTIGIQISAAGLGGALIPGLAGVLAEHISLEAIPAFLTIVFAALLTLYSLSLLRRKPDQENG